MSATSSLTLSSLAGPMGFSTNIGAGFSTAIVGGIPDRFSWNAVFYTLGIASVCALALVLIAILRPRTR